MALLSRWYQSLVEKGDWETLFRAAMYDEEVFAVFLQHATTSQCHNDKASTTPTTTIQKGRRTLLDCLVHHYLVQPSFLTRVERLESSSPDIVNAEVEGIMKIRGEEQSERQKAHATRSPCDATVTATAKAAEIRSPASIQARAPSLPDDCSGVTYRAEDWPPATPASVAAAARFFARGLAYREIHDEVLPHAEALLHTALCLRGCCCSSRGCSGGAVPADSSVEARATRDAAAAARYGSHISLRGVPPNDSLQILPPPPPPPAIQEDPVGATATTTAATWVDLVSSWAALVSECGRTPSMSHRLALLTDFTDAYEQLIAPLPEQTTMLLDSTHPAGGARSMDGPYWRSGAVVAQRSVVRMLAYLCSDPPSHSASASSRYNDHDDDVPQGQGQTVDNDGSPVTAAVTALHHHSNLLSQANRVFLESPDCISRRFAVRAIALISGGFDDRRCHVYRTETLTHVVTVMVPEFICYAGVGFLYAYTRFLADNRWLSSTPKSIGSLRMPRLQGSPLRRAVFSAAVCGGLGVCSHSLVDYLAARRRRYLFDVSPAPSAADELERVESTLRSVRRWQLGSYLTTGVLLAGTLLPLQSVTFPRFMGDVCWRFPFVPRLFPALVGLPSRSKCLIPYVLLPTLTVSCSSIIRDKTRAPVYDRWILK